MLATLTCDTIGELDGGAARSVVNSAIRSALADLDDRGEDGKPRRVVLMLTFERREDGNLDIGLDCTAKLPPYRTAPHTAQIRRDGYGSSARFQTLDPDNPTQKSFEDQSNDVRPAASDSDQS